MIFKKQKSDSVRLNRHSKLEKLSVIQEYRHMIMPVQFSLKQVQIYGCFSNAEIQNIESATIDETKLRQLIVDGLKLSFIYDPLRQSLLRQSSRSQSHFQLKTILRILFRGEFYRFIHNNENQLKMLINNRTTQSNVNILIAGLLIYSSKKFTQKIPISRIDDISTALLFFTLEAALYDSQQTAIPFDTQRIIKILKKIQRVIKPLEFKAWVQTIKSSQHFKGQIEAHHFLFLYNLTERKFTNGFESVLFKPKMQNLFKNLNLNLKINQLQPKQITNEGIQQKRIVRGLSFSESQMVRPSFSKQILRQFRLRDPSKHKRPDTAQLKRHVSTFIPGMTLQQYMSQNAHKNKKIIHNKQISVKGQDCAKQTKIGKIMMSSLRKYDLKLKLIKKKLQSPHKQ